MIATVFFHFRQQNEIVVVPIGTVFAFTQLQASMSGAPEGFGDFLAQTLLDSYHASSFYQSLMVGVYLFADPNDPTHRAFNWNELKSELGSYLQHIWKPIKEWVQDAQFCIMIARQIQRAPYNFEIPLMNTTHSNGT
ncbi:hypothetical protein F5146DRAFT_1135509 [Armillaria mellea]|nr:hypothetical protein F5146DRAFT_1135509 [Armillaria mellea]